MRCRYVGEIGDIVIGRVIEVLQKWRMDIHARQDGGLMLSAINLPGGVQVDTLFCFYLFVFVSLNLFCLFLFLLFMTHAVVLPRFVTQLCVQRRRTVSDEMNMRAFFQEGDLVSVRSLKLLAVSVFLSLPSLSSVSVCLCVCVCVCVCAQCEVQQFYQDGSMSLHTRSLKYGKLDNGVFVAVTPSLIKRSSHTFKCCRAVCIFNSVRLYCALLLELRFLMFSLLPPVCACACLSVC